jgi:hypothetical protein
MVCGLHMTKMRRAEIMRRHTRKILKQSPYLDFKKRVTKTTLFLWLYRMPLLPQWWNLLIVNHVNKYTGILLRPGRHAHPYKRQCIIVHGMAAAFNNDSGKIRDGWFPWPPRFRPVIPDESRPS